MEKRIQKKEPSDKLRSAVNRNSISQSVLEKVKYYPRIIIQKSRKKTFSGSSTYWNQRYVKGGNSGAGSYGRLAEFKARVLNDFVKANDVKSVIEWGSGDGNQLMLANYPFYVGIDVSRLAIEVSKDLFKGDKTKKFYIYDDATKSKKKYDLSLSLDVIYHLVEDPIFEDYMKNLFSSSNKYVIIYASNSDKLRDPAPHVRHRQFTSWVDANQDNKWFLKKTIKNKYPWDARDTNNTSTADFYIFEKI